MPVAKNEAARWRRAPIPASIFTLSSRECVHLDTVNMRKASVDLI
jgi:hypothetical protein